jgi:hypothetical protein
LSGAQLRAPLARGRNGIDPDAAVVGPAFEQPDVQPFRGPLAVGDGGDSKLGVAVVLMTRVPVIMIRMLGMGVVMPVALSVVMVIITVIVIMVVVRVTFSMVIVVVRVAMFMVVVVILSMVVTVACEAGQLDGNVGVTPGAFGQHQPVAGLQSRACRSQQIGLFVAPRGMLEADQVGAGNLQHQVDAPVLQRELGGGDRVHVGTGPADLVLGERERYDAQKHSTAEESFHR